MKFSLCGLFAGGAVSTVLLLAAGGASAATIALVDTDGDGTSILDATGELVGGNPAVTASALGTAFTDVGYFSIAAKELVVSFDLTNLATDTVGITPGVGELTGGAMEIFKVVGNTPVLGSLVNIPVAPPGIVTPSTDYSGSFYLDPGNYYVQIVSSGIDTVSGQGVAKYSVELQGLGAAVPEPATWAVMLVGFGGLGAALRAKRRKQALAAA